MSYAERERGKSSLVLTGRKMKKDNRRENGKMGKISEMVGKKQEKEKTIENK